jgi:protein SCO1/2
MYAALALALVTSACGGGDEPGTLAGIVREPYPDVSAVALPDATLGGESFTTTAREGGLLMVYFGYASCPDICPTTLADLRRAMQQIGEDAARIDVAMVTVDPFRDTPEILASYIQAFFPNGHALVTEDQALLDQAAQAFGAAYEVRQTADGEIEVAHTALMSVVDSTGRILVQWPFGMSVEDMQSDIEFLFDRGV